MSTKRTEKERISSIPGYASLEKGLQRQKGVGPLACSEQLRATMSRQMMMQVFFEEV